MEYAYATLLLNESGEEINERNLKAVLEAAGCTIQESRIKAIVAALEGIDFDDVETTDLDDIEVTPVETDGRSTGSGQNTEHTTADTDDDTESSNPDTDDDGPAVVTTATAADSESSTAQGDTVDDEESQRK